MLCSNKLLLKPKFVSNHFVFIVHVKLKYVTKMAQGVREQNREYKEKQRKC